MGSILIGNQATKPTQSFHETTVPRTIGIQETDAVLRSNSSHPTQVGGISRAEEDRSLALQG